MVAGHLREKSGYCYAVLNYTDSLGKRKTNYKNRLHFVKVRSRAALFYPH